MKREILDSANFGAWKAVVGRNPSLSKWSHGGRRNCASAGPSARWRAIWTDLTLFWPLFLIMLSDIYNKMNRNSRVIPKAVSVGVPYFGEQKWSGEIRQRRKQSHNAHQESTRSAGYLRSYSSVSASGRAHHMPTPRAGLHDQAKESSLWNAYKYIRSDGAFLKHLKFRSLLRRRTHKNDAKKRKFYEQDDQRRSRLMVGKQNWRSSDRAPKSELVLIPSRPEATASRKTARFVDRGSRRRSQVSQNHVKMKKENATRSKCFEQKEKLKGIRPKN